MPLAELIDQKPRAGSHVLSLFISPLSASIIRALAEGPMRLAELHERTGWPAESTLRARIADLQELEAIEKRDLPGMPRKVVICLTPMGDELRQVADLLERWLSRAPQTPIELGTTPAKGAIKALAGGWGSTILRVLAAQPLSLTELDIAIPDQSYPVLERRLSIMRATGQVAVLPAEGRNKPYVVTEWVRQAVAPLVWAGRCERRYMNEVASPVTHVEVEAAFLLAMPQIRLPASADGACVLGVGTQPREGDEEGRSIAGVEVLIDRGKLISCTPELTTNPPTWAIGTVDSWLHAVTEGESNGLHLGGRNPKLAQSLIEGLADALRA
ncbi:MAG TPA: winged helix-turn-helix transcriptional regulator [Solirubrobacterales bacterium]